MPSDPTPLDRLTDLSEFLPYHFKDGGRLMVPFQPAAAIVTDLRAEVSRLQQENERLDEQFDTLLADKLAAEGMRDHAEAEVSRLTETLDRLIAVAVTEVSDAIAPGASRDAALSRLAAALESPDTGEVVYERTAGGWEATFHESPEPNGIESK